MPLPAGARLGPFEIVAPLGAGGMGEVYRARDTRLDRTVAIKVLAGDLAGDSEFRQRFHTEARAISQLTHPHICTLHDIGEHDGTTFLVMELLTGETLADRLGRGTPEQPALTLDHALHIGIQIADALAAAHAHGIVHRDLKPGNIMLSKAATPSAVTHAKLLDFGLAKAAPVVASTGLSMAATTPPLAVTAQGAILGTIQYMAPEQVEGGAVDARSDIFAFGSVLYEVLTGRKAFEGKTQASVMAAILEREPPPVSALQPRAPAIVDETVKKCLAKDPGERWQSAADLATALRWATSGPLTADQRIADQREQRARGRVAGAVAIAAVAAAAGVSLGWVASRYLSDTVPTPEAVVFEVPPPPNATFSPSPVASAAQMALSPDGRRLAFVAAPRRGVSQIWVRRLDSAQAQPLAGTERASFPFWSPDGRAIAFFADGKLKKIDLAGGVPYPLADAGNARGGAWSPSGDIVFTPSPINPLMKVSSAGGTVSPETTLNTVEGAVQHYWPQFLADGRRLLYYQRSSKPEHQGIYVKTLGSSDAKRVLNTDGMAVYTPGHLLFVRDGMLFAVSFDDQTLQAHGDPVRLADNVGFWGAAFGYVTASASATGALAYGPSAVMTTNLQWRSRGGGVVGTPTRPNVYRSPRLSPDESSVAFSMGGPQNQGMDIYVLELTRGGLSRVTASPGNDWFPVWPPDGTGLYFASTRAGPSTLFQKPLGGAGDGEPVTAPPPAGHYPTDVSGDAGLVISQQITTAAGGYDIVVVRVGKARTADPFLVSPFNEVQARLSPNGRWLAYASDESGRFEIYVRSFPAPGPQVPISVNGGMQPEWRRDGRELFFVSGDGKLMAVDVVTVGATFTGGGVPRALFDIEIPEPVAPYPSDYAVSSDGQRFFVNTIDDQPTRPSLTVILNWAAGLKRD